MVGGRPRSPVLGELAPFLVLTLMTWYLLILVVRREEIIAGLAAIFSMRRKPQAGRMNFWLSVVTYSIILAVGILAVWSGIPQRLLSQIQQQFAQISATASSLPTPPPQTSPITGLLPTAIFINYGLLVSTGIFVVSLILVLSGLRLAFKTKQVSPDEDELELQVQRDASVVVQRTITDLMAERAYHETILQCYKNMCKILAKVGVVVSPTETAREFALTVSGKLGIGKEAVAGLTFLFEEARYSDHQISDANRINAVNYLKWLQDALSSNIGAKT